MYYLHFPSVTEISEDSANGKMWEEKVRELGMHGNWGERDNDYCHYLLNFLLYNLLFCRF